MGKQGKRIDDKTKKKIIADYITCQSYRKVATKYGVAVNTVKNIINSDPENAQKCTQKRDSNILDTLQYMDEQHSMKRELLDDILKAMGDKAKNPDMFTNIKDLATAYGITVDKELKLEEIKIKKKENELKQRELALYNELKEKRILIPAEHIGSAFVDLNRSVSARKYLEYWLEGGRASIKSSFASEKTIELLYNNPNMCAMAIRKVKDTLKDSVYSQLLWAISQLELDEEFHVTKSPLEITRKATGQKIYFRGADDPVKIKSTRPPKDMYIGIVWYEEFDQMNGMDEVRTINQSIIRGGEDFVQFYTFNTPRSRQHFVNKEKLVIKDNRLVHHSTYLQAPRQWLGGVFINEAEHLKGNNFAAYEHEYLGVANGTGGNVFDNLENKAISDELIKKFDRIYQGIDWGWYPDPFAFVRLHYDAARETIYIIDELYVNKQSNEQTSKWIKDKKYHNVLTICDSAEMKSVNDMIKLKVKADAAIKGPGSVEYGMKWLQRRKIVIDPKRTPNALREFNGYEYERDKEGNIISGYPDKNNHIIDAVRYALERLIRGSKTVA